MSYSELVSYEARAIGFDYWRVRCLAKWFGVCLLLVSSMSAQVKIQNPDRLEVPELRAQVVFYATCKVVADEFHLKHADSPFPIVLVLGEPNERYTSDEEHQLYTLYLYRWNEAQFAASAMRLAVQHAVTQTRRDRMLKEILRRSDRIGTVSAKVGAVPSASRRP